MSLTKDDILALHSEIGTSPEPYDRYVRKGQFDEDCEKIFKKVWINVGRVEELPAKGGYIVCPMGEWKSSIIITKDKNGKFSAFHNVCTHRGNELIWDERGSERRYACKFHGWVFKDDGSLVGAPEAEMFFSLDKKKCGLKKVSLDIWNGFIFVHYESSPPQSLREFLEPVATTLDAFPFGKLSVAYEHKIKLGTPWRIARDSQLEGYHAKHLHRRSLPHMIDNKEAPNIHCVDAKLLGQHGMVGLVANKEAKLTPTQLLSAEFGSFTANRHDGVTTKKELPINLTKSNQWSFDLYFIYPNFHLIVLDDMVIAHNMRANADGESTWIARSYYPEATNGAEWFSREYAKVTLRDAWMEDMSTLERTYNGLCSGVLDAQHMQGQELLIRAAEFENEKMLAI